jgi:hypothetical protein
VPRRAAHHASIDKEATMTLDDVYGSDLDKFPLEQEAANWDEEDLGLIWDETEVQRIAQQYGKPHRFDLH